ncbi:MAG TPA: vanadium-dependent haloperoxidase [Chitinophagaceae bacterium]|nr:vanadium-dependent haloperoxidase [Chitinophagaceae bacterium]
MKILLIIIGWLCMTGPLAAQQPAWTADATPLHRAEKALTDVMVHDVFSPNVASRAYVYANIAAYEVLAAQNAGYRSLYGQIKSFPKIAPKPAGASHSLAAVYAFLLVGKKLVFSEQALQDSIVQMLRWYKARHLSASGMQQSLDYGKQVADTVIHWMNADQYRETRRLRRYNFSKQEGKWLPTPPGYMAAVEPYWNKIRPLTLDSASQFQPPLPTAYSKDKQSAFYKEAYEVYQAGLQMTAAQRETANFWDCNPFFLATQGHLNFAAKKISPAGHWISIVGIACRQARKDLTASAAAYTLTSIALFDGFISCWDEKYRSNLIRPETYINANIDESWRPLLQTPPFPEYTSGHSVISTASAVVLTSLLGPSFGFDDNSEIDYGLPARHFNSFEEAANQAAISRLYGGIHYRPAIENGQQQGRKLGEWVLAKIRLTDN